VKGSKGFSLLELLVVIAILGIIAAIALPRYFEAVDDAKKNAQRANIAIIKTSLEVYRNKNKSYPTDVSAFNQFLSNPAYFSEIPECPYNGKKYQAVDLTQTSTYWNASGNEHILGYQGGTDSYTFTYIAP